MSLPAYGEIVGGLAAELRSAQALTPDLLAKIIAGACPRLMLLSKAGKTARLAAFVNASAWTDAALTIVELELPAWRLRRLARDDGEWHCSLSKAPYLPMELDDTADGRHEISALAILDAFLEARRRTGDAREARTQTAPHAKSAHGHAICCDNFS